MNVLFYFILIDYLSVHFLVQKTSLGYTRTHSLFLTINFPKNCSFLLFRYNFTFTLHFLKRLLFTFCCFAGPQFTFRNCIWVSLARVLNLDWGETNGTILCSCLGCFTNLYCIQFVFLRQYTVFNYTPEFHRGDRLWRIYWRHMVRCCYITCLPFV